jgi:predicted nucleic acid-binding protein
MQAIVSDTTRMNYLVLIQTVDILPNLYRKVLIPPAVKAELLIQTLQLSRARGFRNLPGGWK